MEMPEKQTISPKVQKPSGRQISHPAVWVSRDHKIAQVGKMIQFWAIFIFIQFWFLPPPPTGDEQYERELLFVLQPEIERHFSSFSMKSWKNKMCDYK